jgi:hypothetical protein
MKLYLGDTYGVPVPDTEFWITLSIIKERLKVSDNTTTTKVTIQIPAINFRTGPYANNIYETTNSVSEIIDKVLGVFLPTPQNGGYLYTSDGFLPKNLNIMNSWVIFFKKVFYT